MFLSNESIEHLCVKKIDHNYNIPEPKKKKKINKINLIIERTMKIRHCLLCLTVCFK